MPFFIWTAARKQRPFCLPRVYLFGSSVGKAPDFFPIQAIRPSLSENVHNIMLRRHGASRNYPESILFYAVRQLQQGIFKSPVSKGY